MRLVLTFLFLSLLAQPAFAGAILREVWEGISGTSVADLTSVPEYPNQPASSELITDFFEAPVDVMEDYGQRMHGYIVPPVTGLYTFWIATDDGGELWLSTDSNPIHQALIANVNSWTNSREWTREANQESAPVQLTKGKPYYIAALQKEGGGGDNLAVRWLRPDGLDEGPIPAAYLLPFGTSFTPPVISQQPENTTAVEGQFATFTVQVGNLDTATYRWERNGSTIPGADSSILQFGPVTLAQNDSRFQAFLSNQLGSTNTTIAVLTVLPDTTRPELVSALNLGPNKLRIIFSEPLDPTTALNSLNYSIDQGVSVTSAAFGNDQRTVILTTSAMQFGTTYTARVSGIRDLAASPNTLAAGSQLTFTAVEYVPWDIGNPLLAGGNVPAPGGFDVTGGGKTIGGSSDSFQYSWQEKTGDFDLQVRIASLTVPDPYVRAGLMVRQTLEPNSRFGAVFAGSPQIGCFFESRTSVTGQGVTVAPVGGFPVNYPYTWLRLRRQGTAITGFASVDAQTWTQLGTATLSSLPATVYIGFALSSDTESATATAQFRDLGPAQQTATGTFVPDKEPFGPSSRATGMILSEIMYHPPARADGRNLEFVELANARSVGEDLSGWRLSGDIDYVFPAGLVLPAGEFLVIAAAPEDIKAVYGITNVLGPYTGKLSRDTGTLRLRNDADAIRLELTYQDAPPWPVAADGAGHSLVLAKPSYGEANPAAWSASELAGGSPGGIDPAVPDPRKSVMINEFLAHTDLPQVDFIELYNHSNSAVDLSGCWLSDDPSTNRFRIPNGTTIPARGVLAYDSNQLGFRLDASGESLFFVSPDGRRVFDAVRFYSQENGVSSGRYPDGDPQIRRLSNPTPGASNSTWRQEEIVINEIMYAPISGDDQDQYLELYNRSAQPVNLGGWKLSEGISFTFPANATVPAHGYLVVANNANQLRATHPQLSTANTFGNFDGKLSDNSERIVLTKPHWLIATNLAGALTTNLIHIRVADLAYGVGGRWGQWANGGGSSLELIDPDADPLRAANWADSDESTKAPWTSVSITNRLDNGDSGFSVNRFRIAMQGSGECLVDDLEVFRDGSTNLLSNGGFEKGATGWTFSGNQSTSSVETSGAATGSSCLHVRGQDDGDTGVNSIRCVLPTGLASGNTGVIRAKVRWLKGWPEVLFRLQGNFLELSARMALPSDLGSPGMPNSRLVNNAGPALFDVTHRPALPRANQAVKVFTRVSDPDGLGSIQLQYRIDPSASLQSVAMNDAGAGGDEIAGDGVYTATIPGQGSGTLAAFRITASDSASASSVFPAGAPARECLIRWNDPVPFGTFGHHHLWSTQATEGARNSSYGLDNTWRDATFVYGDFRVMYNAGFRDKGSPYHSGYGDFVVSLPDDDLLLGAKERDLAATGNGGQEGTNIRSQLAAWLAQKLGIPYLHANYTRLYRNGGAVQSISEDLEVPNRSYINRWFPEGGRADFYKMGVWFEFRDNPGNFDATGLTLQRFTTVGGVPKLARYRWNWQRRPDGGTSNNYTNVFDLVDAANDSSTNYTTRLLNLADMDEWMRVFAYHRIMGNWDSWTYNVGQNMFAMKQPGLPWKLLPWDIDFTFGLGDGSSSALGGGSFRGGSQDPVANKFYDTPAFRRMLWRAYQDAVTGPMLSNRYAPQISARRSILLKNQVTDSADPRAINTYIEQRRNYILRQLTNNDASVFAITSPGGTNFATSSSTTTLAGTAPFAVATIEINGVPYPVRWSSDTAFQIVAPLPAATNILVLAGKNRQGQPVPGASQTLQIINTGALPKVKDFVSISEILYNPAESGASFIELFNRSSQVPFDLSGFRLDGVKYTFPPGALIQPNSHLLLVKDRAAFAKAFGATIPVFGEFEGSLDNNGEHLSLVQPGTTPEEDQLISDVRYSNRLPWPVNAAGFGPSLQLVDPAQDAYRAGNWGSTETNAANRVTPGRLNATSQSLAAFPTVWINEVQSINTGAFTDGAGQAEPWIELFNSGSTPVDLSPFYMTDSYTNLTKWSFPAGTSIGPKQFLVLWADGQTGQGSASAPHLSFRLSDTNGSIALVRLQGVDNRPAVMDYIDFPQMAAGISFGSVADGEPRQRRLLFHATAGAANDPSWPSVPVRINEILADNTQTLIDPANNQPEDWFELYNAGSATLDLGGYTLTDDLTQPEKFLIPPGTIIPANGFLLCWADSLSSSNRPASPLHVNFKLAKGGSDIGLFDPALNKVDGFTYGAQTNDVSVGRFPDGADLPLLRLDLPTPAAPNFLSGGNRPPVFTSLPAQTAVEKSLLSFVVNATDPDAGQQVIYSLETDAPAGAAINPQTGAVTWTPSEQAGPGTVTFYVRATDTGTPARSSTLPVTIQVQEVNEAPAFAPISPQTVDQGQPLAFNLHATDPDLPGNTLTFSLDPGAQEGATIDPQSGLFSWTPPFSQPPGDYTFTSRVTDNGVPPLSGTTSFTATVKVGPKPPVITPLLPATVNELTLWQTTVQAIDPDTPASGLSFSLDVSPAGAQIDHSSGLLSWTPTEAQGPTNAVFVVRVTKTSPPNLSATATFSVNVLEVNRGPTLSPIPDQTIGFGETLVLTNIVVDPDLPANTLSFALEPGAPAGMTVASDTGVLTWTPSANQVLTTNRVTVRVTDGALSPLSDSQSFTVIVKRGLPWKFVSALGTASSSTVYIYLTAPGDVYIDDLTLVAGEGGPGDVNLLRNGDFETGLTGSWTVSPNHSGSSVQSGVRRSGQSALHVVAASGGTTRASSIYQEINPALSSGDPYRLSFWYLPGTNNTSLTIRLSGNGINIVTPIAALTNSAPVLAAPGDWSIATGETVRFTATASDADLPNDTLVFSLEPPVPAGASINPASGLFAWTPSASQAPSTNRFSLVVTDSGVPPKSDRRSFTVTVKQPALNAIAVGLSDQGLPTLAWDAQIGRRYRVEYKNSLSETAWQTYIEFSASSTRVSMTDQLAGGLSQRFYRIVQLP